MDECFENITLLQTKKLKPIPIILYGSDFWSPLVEGFIKPVLMEKYKTISPADLSIFTVTDDDNLVLDVIKNAKPRTGNHGD